MIVQMHLAAYRIISSSRGDRGIKRVHVAWIIDCSSMSVPWIAHGDCVRVRGSPANLPSVERPVENSASLAVLRAPNEDHPLRDVRFDRALRTDRASIDKG